MECRECGRIEATNQFYDHVFGLNSTAEECSCKLKNSTLISMPYYPTMPRRSSVTLKSGNKIPHNRTISSIRGGGLSRKQILRGSANALFNPETTYAFYG